jgi:hypothetical protein
MNRLRIFNNLSNLATAACYVGPAFMIVADITTITLNHNVSPFSQTISGYAVGPYGWLERLGMVLIAVSFLAIAANLLMVKNTGRLSRLKFIGGLLVIVATGFLMLSIFNTNVIGTIINFHGLVHQLASAAVSVVFYLACFVTMSVMINQTGFRYYSLYSGLTFLVGLVVLILLGVTYQQNNYVGLLERLIAGFNLVWIVLVGPQVIKLAKALQ